VSRDRTLCEVGGVIEGYVEYQDYQPPEYVISNLLDRLSRIEEDIEEIKERLARLEARVAMVSSTSNLIKLLIQYVILPLITILGGLVGVKILVSG